MPRFPLWDGKRFCLEDLFENVFNAVIEIVKQCCHASKFKPGERWQRAVRQGGECTLDSLVLGFNAKTVVRHREICPPVG